VNRRPLLRAALAGVAGAVPACWRGATKLPEPPTSTPWPEADAILARTALPRIPANTVDVREGSTIQDTIDACHASGGGRVVVPPGSFHTGALRLRSCVELHLSEGATLRFSEDPERFPPVPTRYEGLECVNRSPPIYALDETDVALTGGGALDASATAAWNRGADRAGVLEPLVSRGVPAAERVVTGRLRTCTVEMIRCSRVRIEGVRISGSQFWQVHPTLCTDVTIDGVTTARSGSNSDACDPESCDRVVIRRCTFASGDDDIALKSGRDEDGRRLAMPCRNVVILGCQVEGSYAFIACGSEQSGGIENVYAFANRAYGRGVLNALFIKSSSRRGGFTRNVRVRDFRGPVRGAAVAMTMRYDGQSGSHLPVFEGIHVDDLAVEGADAVLDVEGLPESPIRGFSLSNSVFDGVRAPDAVRYAGIVRRNVTVNGRRCDRPLCD
jgi:hypothetical protein